MKKTLPILTALLAIAVVVLLVLFLRESNEQKAPQYGDCRDTAMTQKEMNECTWSLLREAEVRLEEFSDKARTYLSSGDWIVFEDSQRGWNGSVVGFCKSEEARWRRGGGKLPLIVHMCYLRFYESRLEDLIAISSNWEGFENQEY